jgi:predicted site-specific integrase-resolvase
LKVRQTTFLDVTYYLNQENISNGIVMRKWALNKFGIDIPKYSFESRAVRYTDKQYIQLFQNYIELAFNDKSWLNSIFPLPKNVDELIEQELGVEISAISKSVGIHLRQGDYKFVASKIISDFEYANLMSQLSKIMTRRENQTVVIFSDENVQKNDFPILFELLEQEKFEVIVLDSRDDFLTHCAMRKVRILICANSTFSFSAALLREGLSFFPREFYKDGSSELNSQFALSSNWLVRE